ncbi:MAG: hypothetical protein J7641_21120 [Cyanobacteria bacterium SID2]|nr:hypothetical protein [Cyanobacteria bacterium SID2]
MVLFLHGRPSLVDRFSIDSLELDILYYSLDDSSETGQSASVSAWQAISTDTDSCPNDLDRPLFCYHSELNSKR